MKALITGASSGIGRDMARELDKKGYDLVLVSRDEEKLQEVKKSLKGKNIEVIPIPGACAAINTLILLLSISQRRFCLKKTAKSYMKWQEILIY